MRTSQLWQRRRACVEGNRTLTPAQTRRPYGAPTVPARRAIEGHGGALDWASTTRSDTAAWTRLETLVERAARRDARIRRRGAVMSLELISPPDVARLPPDEERHPPGRVGLLVTSLIVGLPFVALLYAVVHFWGHGIAIRDLLLAVIVYFVIGHGMTVGFHRLLAHKAFVARRPLKIGLLVLGSMAFEGGPIGWVTTHRRHHVFADTPTDPHSPVADGFGLRAQLGGLWHAHLGWLFSGSGTPPGEDAADLLADRDIVVIDRLFPLWCAVSLAIPFGLGWFIGGTMAAALSALLWAGLVRICVLHHVTWSVNSLCHVFGGRPFTTKDRSSNIGLLAVVTFGESWHNGHHAFPRSARHGLLPRQWDSSAMLISGFQHLGWADDVHTPSAEAIERRRIAL
jgi:stearoyl-CoA desaturase (Delta-9 desaturase)